MKRWLLSCFFASALCAVDFNDPESVLNQDFLLSFWRSGTNWLFTCIHAITQKPIRYIAKDSFGEYCSNMCTNHLRIPADISKKPLFQTHSCAFAKPFSQNNRLIVIVRDYKEVVMRNVLDNSEAFAQAIEEETFFDYYCEYLALFDQWHPEKRLLIYYEDLLQYPRQTLAKVLQFLGETQADLDAFMSHYDQYRSKTISSYHAQYLDEGGSASKGVDIHYHSKLLSKELQFQADELMQSKYPALWNRYLKRYQ